MNVDTYDDDDEILFPIQKKGISITFSMLKTTFLFLYQFSEFCVDNYILF